MPTVGLAVALSTIVFTLDRHSRERRSEFFTFRESCHKSFGEHVTMALDPARSLTAWEEMVRLADSEFTQWEAKGHPQFGHPLARRLVSVAEETIRSRHQSPAPSMTQVGSYDAPLLALLNGMHLCSRYYRRQPGGPDSLHVDLSGLADVHLVIGDQSKMRAPNGRWCLPAEWTLDLSGSKVARLDWTDVDLEGRIRLDGCHFRPRVPRRAANDLGTRVIAAPVLRLHGCVLRQPLSLNQAVIDGEAELTDISLGRNVALTLDQVEIGSAGSLAVTGRLQAAPSDRHRFRQWWSRAAAYWVEPALPDVRSLTISGSLVDRATSPRTDGHALTMTNAHVGPGLTVSLGPFPVSCGPATLRDCTIDHASLSYTHAAGNGPHQGLVVEKLTLNSSNLRVRGFGADPTSSSFRDSLTLTSITAENTSTVRFENWAITDPVQLQDWSLTGSVVVPAAVSFEGCRIGTAAGVASEHRSPPGIVQFYGDSVWKDFELQFDECVFDARLDLDISHIFRGAGRIGCTARARYVTPLVSPSRPAGMISTPWRSPPASDPADWRAGGCMQRSPERISPSRERSDDRLRPLTGCR